MLLFPERLCYQAEREELVASAVTSEIASRPIVGHLCAACNQDLGFVTNKEKYLKAFEIRERANQGMSPEPPIDHITLEETDPDGKSNG